MWYREVIGATAARSWTRGGDRDRGDHGIAAAGRHANQTARRRGAAGHRGGGGGQGRNRCRRLGRFPGGAAAWPSMLRTIYGDPARYQSAYFSQIAGVYFTGERRAKDADGYLWIMGRIDDVLNVSATG